MTKFEAGKTYWYSYVTDEDHRKIYLEIVSRTEKSAVIKHDGEQTTQRRKIYTDEDGNEWLRPNGTYSMCPICRANHMDEPEQTEEDETERFLSLSAEEQIAELEHCFAKNMLEVIEKKVEEEKQMTAMTAEKVKSLIATEPEEVMKEVWSLTSNDVKNIAKRLEIVESENDGIREILIKIANKILSLQEAIEEIRRLTTEDEIKAVLVNCTEADICEIGEEFTGDKWVFQAEYITRECLIKLVARRIAYLFRQNAFLSLTAKEQVAELLQTEPDRVGKKLALCETEQDVYDIAVSLGLNVEDYNYDFYYIVEAIKQRICVMQAKFSDSDGVEKFIPVINGKTYISFVDGHGEKQYHSEIPKWVQL